MKTCCSHISSSCGSPRLVRGSIIAALLLGACQPGEVPDGRADRVVLTSNDVHVVPTPDVLARIVDVVPGGDGSIWVLNSVEPFFVVLGPDGQADRAFGRRGGGPDEFDDPITLVHGSSGQVWTFDNLRRAIRPLSDDQALDRSVPPNLQLVSFENAGMGMVATAPWVESQGTDFLIAGRRAAAPPTGGLGIWHADLYRVGMDSAGVSLERSVPVPDLLSDPEGRYPGATILVPYPLWTVCGDGSLGLYDPVANTIRRFMSDGSEQPSIDLPEARNESATFDRVFGMVYRLFSDLRPGGQAPDSLQMRSVLQQQFDQAEGAFADVFPEYADLRCTEDGTLWLQPFTVTNGRFARSSEWMRIGRNGSRSHVSLPEAFTVHSIEDDRIWGAVVDSLGVPTVAWLAVGG